MPRVELPAAWLRRAAADVSLWAAIGVVMALLGPFGTSERTLGERLAYWLICMVGGGLIGIAIDIPVRRVLPHFWARLAAVSVAMTPPVTVLVAFTNVWLAGMRLTWENLLAPCFQVFVVCFAAMLFRQLVWSRAPVVVVATDAGGDPAEAFRLRLSAKRRAAALIAVEAEDHYLRVHTVEGSDLILMRFADALAALEGCDGVQAHRSWWVARRAVDETRFSRGRGELKLSNGLVVPVSRSFAEVLRDASWA